MASSDERDLHTRKPHDLALIGRRENTFRSTSADKRHPVNKATFSRNSASIRSGLLD